MKPRAFAPLAVLALACAIAWWLARGPFLAAYLAAWWFCAGLMMGGLANVWIHNLTGGAWGEAIRAPLLAIAGRCWLLALLFVPVLLGMHALYPWAAEADAGVQRWAGELEPGSAQFKSAWLAPWFFVVRSLAYLALWLALAHFSRRPALSRSPRFAAAALIVYGFSVSLASVDWIMSLEPLWYSSVFGLLTGVGQMLSGMALAIVLTACMRARPEPGVFRDLGNLLLMYVMTWAYLAFCQFLIIWSANLPHEIAWYLRRQQGGWPVVAWALALFHFALPLVILLFRSAKQAPAVLGALAAALLAFHLVEIWWLILPARAGGWLQRLWALPLATLFAGAVALAARPAETAEVQGG